MFTPARLAKRGALVLAVVALITAVAALSPKRADAQFPWGSGCFPVTTVQPVSSLTGFLVWVPVTRLVCTASFVSTPFCGPWGCVGSAISGVVPVVRSSVFHACPSVGCFFGPPSHRFDFHKKKFDPCDRCRPPHRRW